MWRNVLAVPALLIGTVLVAPVVVMALGLQLVATLTRGLTSLLEGKARAVPWRDLVEYEPEVGWRPRPNLDAHAQADDVFRLTTGPDGWRGRVPVADSDIVVFGDSFAFGHAAPDEEMYTEFTAGLEVKPIGSDGYDMVHGLLWMKRLAPELSGKLVVWFIYYGNDLHENLLPNMGKYRMPYVRQRRDAGPRETAWEVVTEHVSREPWPYRSPTSYHGIVARFSSPTPFSRKVFSACEYLIDEARRVCEEAGARLAVVGVPDRVQLTARGQEKLSRLAPDPEGFDVRLPDKELFRITNARGIPFISLSRHLTWRDYLIHDIHWRRSGHRKVGRLLRELYHEARVAPPRGTPARLSPRGAASEAPKKVAPFSGGAVS